MIERERSRGLEILRKTERIVLLQVCLRFKGRKKENGLAVWVGHASPDADWIWVGNQPMRPPIYQIAARASIDAEITLSMVTARTRWSWPFA